MAGKTKKPETADITFEAAMTRLEGIVARLDTGESPLDEALALFGEGAALVKHCGGLLEKAKLTVETLFPEGAEDKTDE